MSSHFLKNALKSLLILLLLGWYAIFLIQPINLAAADLGRHLKNGELILAGDSGPLYSNYYSYTEPTFPFVNHHWLSGLVFYLVQQAAGFFGLSIFFIVLSLLTFLIFFFIAYKNSSFGIAAILAILLIPLIAYRREIRPEIFTYLLSAIYFYLLIRFDINLISRKKLLLFLLPLMLLWVNLHIGFIFGFFLVGVFWLKYFIKLTAPKKILFLPKHLEKFKFLSLSLVFLFFTALINPAGLKGVLYPLNIFKHYGYEIIENKSVWFLENYGFIHPDYFLIKLTAALVIFTFTLLLILNKNKFNLPFLIISCVFAVLGLFMIRNATYFALFALPILAYNTKILITMIKQKIQNRYLLKLSLSSLSIIIVLFSLLANYKWLEPHLAQAKIGVYQNVNRSAVIFKQLNLKGPIFNNYDIGSYLIYFLFPQEKVFVDNRPESYSYNFFQQVYIPMQKDDNIWHKVDKQYNFNVIYFYRHDVTPWAQNFMIKRLDDPAWVPIYVDNFAIIFIKNTRTNKSLIDKYRIPREYFKVVNN